MHACNLVLLIIFSASASSLYNLYSHTFTGYIYSLFMNYTQEYATQKIQRKKKGSKSILSIDFQCLAETKLSAARSVEQSHGTYSMSSNGGLGKEVKR